MEVRLFWLILGLVVGGSWRRWKDCMKRGDCEKGPVGS